MEDMRVSQLCDDEHLAHLIPAEDRASSRECARMCQIVIDTLADAGAPRPKHAMCSAYEWATGTGGAMPRSM
jgi:hypothetical protein